MDMVTTCLCKHGFFQAGSLHWKISQDSINFEGQANFRFTIYTQDGKAVWRNGKDAQSTISVSVKQGRYSVLLGGQGMDPISPELFLENETLFFPYMWISMTARVCVTFPGSTHSFRPSCVVCGFGRKCLSC